jgi:hypothetical protein
MDGRANARCGRRRPPCARCHRRCEQGAHRGGRRTSRRTAGSPMRAAPRVTSTRQCLRRVRATAQKVAQRSDRVPRRSAWQRRGIAKTTASLTAHGPHAPPEFARPIATRHRVARGLPAARRSRESRARRASARAIDRRVSGARTATARPRSVTSAFHRRSPARGNAQFWRSSRNPTRFSVSSAHGSIVGSPMGRDDRRAIWAADRRSAWAADFQRAEVGAAGEAVVTFGSASPRSSAAEPGQRKSDPRP